MDSVSDGLAAFEGMKMIGLGAIDAIKKAAQGDFSGAKASLGILLLLLDLDFRIYRPTAQCIGQSGKSARHRFRLRRRGGPPWLRPAGARINTEGR